MYDEEDEYGYKSADVRFIPTIAYYERTYGKSVEGNDPKGCRVFREYESAEKKRRLEQELIWVKSGMVAEEICDQHIGKKRKAKWQSYENWGAKMLLWLSQGR